MIPKTIKTTTLSIVAGIVAILLNQSVFAAEISQETITQAYERISPAIAVVKYSTEITHVKSGEISKRDNTALGLLVSSDGLVMTHGHMVLDNAQPFNISVTVGRGTSEMIFDATLLKKPDDVNIVFLQIQTEEKTPFPYVTFSKEKPLQLGDPLLLIGLFSESLDYEPGIQTSRVAAVLEEPRTTYCLDGAVRFGFVGGPALNATGEVVGVIGFDLSYAEGGDLYVRSGHPLIYQYDLFKQYIDTPPGEDTLKDDEDKAWLGVFTQPLTDDFATYWDLPKQGGLIVSSIVPGSPAENVPLLTGDVIIEFDGTPIRAKQDRDVVAFSKLVREAGADREVIIRVLRNGEPVELKGQLGTRPRSARDADEFEEPIFGLTVREITTDVRIALNLAEDVKGVIVRRVKSGSPAQIARMQPGVIILGFGDYPVTDLDSFKTAVEKVAAAKPREVAIFARVGSATGFFRLAPRWENE